MIDMSNLKKLVDQSREMEEWFKQFSANVPKIRMPRRAKDCPASPVCEAIGNLRHGCTAGAVAFERQDPEVCMAGILLLIARLAGMWPQQMIEAVEEHRRKIGFDLGKEDVSVPEP